MSNESKNGKVTWIQLVVILGIAGTILSTLWIKLEKIDDNVGEIKIDIAIIRQQIDGKHLLSSETDKKNN